MSCIISGILTDGSGTPLSGKSVTATPLYTPIRQLIGGVWTLVSDPWPSAITAVDGSWSFTLLWPSETSPDSVEWRIDLDGGTRGSYAGMVPDLLASVTLPALVDPNGSYKWQDGTTAEARTPIPPGPQGAIGPQGPAGAGAPDATTTASGSVKLRTAPSGAHPVALTTDDLGTASGPAPLDSDSRVPAANLPANLVTTVATGRYWSALADNGGTLNGTTDCFTALSSLITSLGSTVATILIAGGTALLSNSLTIPSTITLECRNGGMLKPASGKTVTHAGDITTAHRQIFDLSAGGSVSLTGVALEHIYVEWFGAKADATGVSGVGADSSVGILAAIAAVPTGTSANIHFAGNAYRVTQMIQILDATAGGNRRGINLIGVNPQEGGSGVIGTCLYWDGAGPTVTPPQYRPLVGYTSGLPQFVANSVQPGNVDTGFHAWAVTYTTAAGETILGPVSLMVQASGGACQFNLTLPVNPDPTVTGINVYRSKANTMWPLLLVNTGGPLSPLTSTYTDNVADASLGTAYTRTVMLSVQSRFNRVRNIQLACCTGKWVYAFAEYDYPTTFNAATGVYSIAAGALAVTNNLFEDCLFGVNYAGLPSSGATVGMLVGKSSQANTDFLKMLRCRFQQPPHGIFCPTANGNSLHHEIERCAFGNALISCYNNAGNFLFYYPNFTYTREVAVLDHGAGSFSSIKDLDSEWLSQLYQWGTTGSSSPHATTITGGRYDTLRPGTVYNTGGGGTQFAPPPMLGAGTTGSFVDTGSHFYVITMVTANGESVMGTAASITLAAAAQVNVAIPMPFKTEEAAITGYNIYRTKVGASNTRTNFFKINASVIAPSTGHYLYADTTPDASLSATNPPSTNTATFTPSQCQEFVSFGGSGPLTLEGWHMTPSYVPGLVLAMQGSTGDLIVTGNSFPNQAPVKYQGSKIRFHANKGVTSGGSIVDLQDFEWTSGADSVQWQNSGGTALSGVSSVGTIYGPHQIGTAGTILTQAVVYSQTITPASVAANTSAEQTFTTGFTGLATTDKVIVNGPTPTAGTGIVNARVSAVNTLALTWQNSTAGALTPASGTYTIIAIRS